MITTASLKEYTLKDLAQMAKKRGIAGWHSMRKAELIQALVRDARASSKNGASRKSSSPSKRTVKAAAGNVSRRPRGKVKGTNGEDRKGASKGNSRVARRIQKAQEQNERKKDLSTTRPTNGHRVGNGHDCRDRIVLMVRDAYWLHVHWELTSRTIQRAQAAMAEHWHTAKPVLRLYEVATGATTSTAESHLRDISIHGGVNNWYIDVLNPPKGYRVEIGYLAANDRFHAVARSNTVVTPPPGSSDMLDENWTDVAANCERIFALSGGYSPESSTQELQELFEERLRRPMGSPMVTRYGVGAELLEKELDFKFDVDAEMIIYGSTKPDAHVTLAGEPVKLRPDGTFTVRMSMPDRRQVLPVVSSSRDGMKQQTIVLAVERNTKVMEQVVRDANQ